MQIVLILTSQNSLLVQETIGVEVSPIPKVILTQKYVTSIMKTYDSKT